MKLWPVEHFWLTFFPDQDRFSADLEKKGAKNVQLVRGSFFLSDFLQNPYFSDICFMLEMGYECIIFFIFTQ